MGTIKRGESVVVDYAENLVYAPGKKSAWYPTLPPTDPQSVCQCLYPGDKIWWPGVDSKAKDLTGLLTEEEAEELGLACQQGDAAKAGRLLGASKLGGGSGPQRLEVDLATHCRGPKAVETLFKAMPKTLTELALGLRCNQLGVPGAKVIADGLKTLTGLTILKLDVGFNRLGVAGVKALCEGIPRTLTTLILSLQSIPMGPAGAQALADAMPPGLVFLKLDLHGCQIKDEGCLALAKALPQTIEKLHLFYVNNGITITGQWIFDRLIDTDGLGAGVYGVTNFLPKLTNDKFIKQCFLDCERVTYDKFDRGILNYTHEV